MSSVLRITAVAIARGGPKTTLQAVVQASIHFSTVLGWISLFCSAGMWQSVLKTEQRRMRVLWRYVLQPCAVQGEDPQRGRAKEIMDHVHVHVHVHDHQLCLQLEMLSLCLCLCCVLLAHLHTQITPSIQVEANSMCVAGAEVRDLVPPKIACFDLLETNDEGRA